MFTQWKNKITSLLNYEFTNYWFLDQLDWSAIKYLNKRPVHHMKKHETTNSLKNMRFQKEIVVPNLCLSI